MNTTFGYTENELSVFLKKKEYVKRDKLKLCYNEYNFLGDSVYNLFDILLFLDRKKYKNYWSKTGNPSFLIDLIRENNYNPVNIENVEISEEDLGV